MDGNLVLRRRASEDVKRDFGPYISQNESFEYGYPQSNACMQSRFKAAYSRTSSNVINDVKLCPVIHVHVLSQIFKVIQ